MALKRVSSGIAELDSIVGGGLPVGDIILYSGIPGTGKTIACIQFIADGLKNGESCIYVAGEESRGKLLEHAKLLGFNFNKAVKDEKLEIFQVEDIAFNDPLGRSCKLPRDPEKRIERLTAAIKSCKQKTKATRLVIDSLIAYALDEGTLHNTLLNSELFRAIDELEMTTVIVSEMTAGSKTYSRDGISEILADGIVLFEHVLEGNKGYKTLEVVKMRDSKIIDEVKKFDIAKGGIKFIK